MNAPCTFTFPQLLAQSFDPKIVTLKCVESGVAGEASRTAKWEGVRLKNFQDRASVRTDDVFLEKLRWLLMSWLHVEYGLPAFTPSFFDNVR